mmetsp:Transcript_24230/g.35233  ORF Transcript_24230/g.35233 Transcript_24230/m.35233 type:complete len:497 (-) Transcript_24230:313-1803(-)
MVIDHPSFWLDLRVYIREGSYSIVLFPHLIIQSVIKHLTELLAGHERVSIQALVATNLASVLLHGQDHLLGVPGLLLAHLLRHTVGAEVKEHLVVLPLDEVLWLAQEGLVRGLVEDGNGEHQQGVDLKPLVEEVNTLGHLVNGDDDVLDNVLVDHLLANLGGHRQLEERNFGGAQPAKQVPVDGVVSKGDEVPELPENRASEAVVVMADGDVLVKLATLSQGRLHMQVVPWLPEVVHAIDLLFLLGGVGYIKLSHHDHRSFLGVYGGLKQGWGIVLLGKLLHLLAEVILGVAGDVGDVHKRLDRDDLQLHCHQEANGSVGPRQSVVEVRVLVLAGANQLPIGGDNLKGNHGLLDEPIEVAVGLHPQPHAQPPNGEVLHLHLDGQLVTHGHQVAGHVPHVHEGFSAHGHLIRVHLKNVPEINLDAVAVLLEGGSAHGHGQPGLSGSAHHLLAPQATLMPALHLFLHYLYSLVMHLWCYSEFSMEPISPFEVGLEKET